MFADPQGLTVGATNPSLPAVMRGANESVYRTADDSFTLRVSHQTNKNGRRRRVVRIDGVKVAADPLTAVNQSVSSSVYLVIDEPAFGWADGDLTDVVTALKTWLSPTNIGKLLGGES